ncbi:D-amino-acid transaminase [Lysinibacillus sp. 2017]|uniref:D-amino-acid transaminase n=1 Tax=unclassified Lysinibacillus TaxID=2636778 RepID=UPI000D52A6BD|nr:MULTISPECIES: D-amino-acid transaminase [unclassified Lysinibacillus]AWE08376.1 D-amino-acid transaminase [Lysinibacillus sp. 2017]TGN35858.1 D-amino-acid transaminase [Lysinibacillus sp. S2017]
MGYSLLNDQIVKDEEIVVDKEDRGYQFGDGVYEVVKVYNGELFTAKEHIDRFYASAEKIRITIPYTKDKLHQLIHRLVEANQVDTGHVYFQITRGTSPRNHIFPGDDVLPVLTGNTKENPRPVQNFENGVKATFVEDIRWLRCDIKSLNLLGAVLAKQEAHEKGCYEAILHRAETVTEGSASNIYGIKDGVLYTHPADNFILNGITRQVILKCAEEIGMSVKEEAFTKEQLLMMDEAIVSSTTSEVTPIIDIDGTIVGGGTPGEWTRKLQAQFETKIPKGIRA